VGLLRWSLVRVPIRNSLRWRDHFGVDGRILDEDRLGIGSAERSRTMSTEKELDAAYNAEVSRAELVSVHPFKDLVVLRGEADARNRAANGCVLSGLAYESPRSLGRECVCDPHWMAQDS